MCQKSVILGSKKEIKQTDSHWQKTISLMKSIYLIKKSEKMYSIYSKLLYCSYNAI